MLNVLFVDDEPNILQGTRRATRDMNPEWNMFFADNGADAIATVSERDIDVVVTDMRMPGMDGAELLKQVKLVNPGAARILLSGYAEEEAIERATWVAHQFLAKPCDVERLKNTIERIRNVRGDIEPKVVRELIGRVDQLPALGRVYDDLMAAIARPNTTNADLGDIISQDIALSVQLLRLVNSAFFGLSRPVESTAQAIGLLGIDIVRAIVAAHSLFGSDVKSVVDLELVVRRSQEVAARSREIARLNGGSNGEAAMAFLTGMLHDVGLLVLSGLPDQEPAELRAILSCDDITTERVAFGVDRYHVGAYLLSLWAFSDDVVDAIRALADPFVVDAPKPAMNLRLAHEVVLSRHLPAGEPFPAGDDGVEALNEIVATLEDLGALTQTVG